MPPEKMMTSTPYVSCIRSFGKPILPPLMTEEKRLLMRNFKAAACEREARREKRKEIVRSEMGKQAAEASHEVACLATAARKGLKATPLPMPEVYRSLDFSSWALSQSGSTPDNASSGTLVPTTSESDQGDNHNRMSDSCLTLPGEDDAASTCVAAVVADNCPPEAHLVADQVSSDEDGTSRPPLLRSLSFTVEKPSLALLLWRSKSQCTPQEAAGDARKPDDTDCLFSPTATPHKTESSDSLSGTSPTSTDLSGSQPSLVSSKADCEDSVADATTDNGADDVFADADTDFEADDGLARTGFKVIDDGPQLPAVKTTSESFGGCNGADDEPPAPVATRGVVPLRRGETFLRSPRQEGGCVTGVQSEESTTAVASTVSSSQPSASNDSDQRQGADDADQRDSDAETSSVSSEDSFRSTNGIDCMAEMLAEHNKAMAIRSRSLALEFAKSTPLSLNGRGWPSRGTPDTSLEFHDAPLSDDYPSDGEQLAAEQCDGTLTSRLQCDSIVPVDAGGSNLNLLSETKETLQPRWRRSFALLTATVKGHLTRRLMKTDRVQAIIQTIKDTMECALSLHQEPRIRCGTITAQDLELHQRLITQLTSACHELHDVFFEIPAGDRMRLIEHLRCKKASDAANNVLKPLSAATQRALQRRSSRGGASQGANGCRAAVVAAQRVLSAHPAMETFLCPSGRSRRSWCSSLVIMNATH